MVKGVEKFREYFNDHTDKYVIIGGTACNLIIEQEQLNPRATKDIDVILIVEALSPEFFKRFWEFIKEAGYKRNERSDDERKYYRFTDPADGSFPYQVELFARKPDVITLDEDVHITPIPVDDDLSSLSAILMNDEYYNYVIENSTVEDRLNVASAASLICLKAKAFLEMTERKAKGQVESDKHIQKHKADVFRLGVLLTEDQRFEIPPGIKASLETFFKTIAADLPDKVILKNMGAPGDMQKLYDQLLQNFNMN